MKSKLIVVLLVTFFLKLVSALFCYRTTDIFDDVAMISIECPSNNSCFRVFESGTLLLNDEKLESNHFILYSINMHCMQ